MINPGHRWWRGVVAIEPLGAQALQLAFLFECSECSINVGLQRRVVFMHCHCNIEPCNCLIEDMQLRVFRYQIEEHALVKDVRIDFTGSHCQRRIRRSIQFDKVRCGEVLACGKITG